MGTKGANDRNCVNENTRHEKLYVLRNCAAFGQVRNVLEKNKFLVIFKETINCQGYVYYTNVLCFVR